MYYAAPGPRAGPPGRRRRAARKTPGAYCGSSGGSAAGGTIPSGPRAMPSPLAVGSESCSLAAAGPGGAGTGPCCRVIVMISAKLLAGLGYVAALFLISAALRSVQRLPQVAAQILRLISIASAAASLCSAWCSIQSRTVSCACADAAKTPSTASAPATAAIAQAKAELWKRILTAIPVPVAAAAGMDASAEALRLPVLVIAGHRAAVCARDGTSRARTGGGKRVTSSVAPVK